MFCAPMIANAGPLGFPGKNGMPESFADLIEQVTPGVVNIIAVTNGAPGENGSEGQGSGFVVTADGRVVTNYHVIDGADELSVVFGNGERFTAKVVGTDQETDLALLKIQNNREFDYVQFHHGKPIRVGDWVLAIGNPFGIGQSSSVGIISAIGRDAEGSGPYVDYIQTDATINTGNSGGPLFNLKGQVVAVNSAIYSPTGASVGIGYSIPHFMAEGIIDDLKKNGEVKRGFFGASLRTAEMTWGEGQGTFNGGATVEALVQGGPAQLAGIQVEDVIMNIAGRGIMTSEEATQKIATLRAGQTVPFEVLRGTNPQTLTINVTMAARPGKNKIDAFLGVDSSADGDQAPTQTDSDTGLGLVDLSANFRNSIGMRSDQVGVYVDTVAPGSAASRKGILSGMVILQFDQKDVPSVAKFESLLAKAKRARKASVLLKVRTINGSENYVGLPI
ncbi:MAG: trypsin-like peptidase domain-containing protein [Robiginitomaculum sp.]